MRNEANCFIRPLLQKRQAAVSKMTSPPEQAQQPQTQEQRHLLASSESDLFAERDEAFRLVRNLATTAPPSAASSSGQNLNAAAAGTGNTTGSNNQRTSPTAVDLSQFRTILNRYQECPTLLDAHLERMAAALSSGARTIVHRLFIIGRCCNDDNNNNGSRSDAATTAEAAQLLQQLRYPLSALYALSKVRGRKQVQRFLPHGTDDVEPVLSVLRLVGMVDALDRGIIHHEGNCEQKSDAQADRGRERSIVLAATSAAASGSCGTSTGNGMTSPSTHSGSSSGWDATADGEAQWWESTYVLLMWLGMLSLVPFDLTVMDSSTSEVVDMDSDPASDNNNNTKVTLASSILSTSRSHLSDPGPTRDAAAACLASLLSRPDLESHHLEEFAHWSHGVMSRYLRQQQHHEHAAAATSEAEPYDPKLPLLIIGTVQTLAQIYKSGTRSNLMGERHLITVERLWTSAILVADASAPSGRGGRRRKKGGGSSGGGGSPLLRKLLTKLFARVGASYLPPRLASWRYERGGRRSLLANLSSSADSASTRSSPSKESQNISVEAELFYVPDEVEDAMAQLLLSLTDPSTVVRWSAAKGVGRITERLPAICADDVLDAILSNLFSDADRDGAWHGGCLCLAELARRGLLLPKRLGEVVPVVLKATQYDVRRGQHSVGAHVRDAASYACWAFARAYSAEVLRPYIPSLAEAIVLASLFDREVNCRRAASAAFQECVGRQGADNFKHGIDVLQAADYFLLGNRTDAYTSVAIHIATFDEYRRPIIRHLHEAKLNHWDSDIRLLASKALHNLTALDASYFADDVLPQLIKKCTDTSLTLRHGAILGCAEILLALGNIRDAQQQDSSVTSVKGGSNIDLGVSDSIAESLAELVSEIEKARLYRGRGGELMRSAVARFIECLSLCRLPLTVKQQVKLLDSVDACLKHPKEEIQEVAAAALGALTRSYFPVGPSGPSDRLQKRVVDKYVDILRTEDNPAASRGYALGLGRLPKKLLAPNHQVLDAVINTLANAAKINSKVGDEGDAETRRNSIASIVGVCTEVGLVATSLMPIVVPLSKDNVDVAFESLLASMEDYNTDRRGDVGSWCRIAAMKGLVHLTLLAVSGEDDACEVGVASKRLYFDEQRCTRVIGALLKQLSEKLDNVRLCAGTCLEKVLRSTDPILPHIPSRSELEDALGLEQRDHINWANPTVTFPMVMRSAYIGDMFEYVIAGMVISVGGLTESVTKSSTSALLEWTRGARGDCKRLGDGELPFVIHFYDILPT